MGEKNCRGCKRWGDWQRRTEKLSEPSEATPVWDPGTAMIGLCDITDKIVRCDAEACDSYEAR